jgi:prophage antirepressor-like protein
MNPVKELIYNSEHVRIVLINNEPYTCALDVCTILGYKNGRDAILRHCKEKGVVKHDTLTAGGNQLLTYIDKGNVIRLIARSELLEAEKFESWIFDEAIPSILSNGFYSIIPKTYKDALRALADSIEEKEAALMQVQLATTALIAVTPKVEKYDQFLDAGNLISLDAAAKSIGIGRTRLTSALRDKKILYKPAANSVNHVYQKYIDSKHFEVKMHPITKGTVLTNYPQIYVTAKGMSFLQDLFKKESTPISSSS